MGEVWHVVVRIALGWFGLSCVICGGWMIAAMRLHRADRTGVAITLTLLLSGAALLWRSVSPW